MHKNKSAGSFYRWALYGAALSLCCPSVQAARLHTPIDAWIEGGSLSSTLTQNTNGVTDRLSADIPTITLGITGYTRRRHGYVWQAVYTRAMGPGHETVGPPTGGLIRRSVPTAFTALQLQFGDPHTIDALRLLPFIQGLWYTQTWAAGAGDWQGSLEHLALGAFGTGVRCGYRLTPRVSLDARAEVGYTLDGTTTAGTSGLTATGLPQEGGSTTIALKGAIATTWALRVLWTLSKHCQLFVRYADFHTRLPSAASGAMPSATLSQKTLTGGMRVIL